MEVKKEIPIWWKHYYDRFMEKVEEFRDFILKIIPEIPKFTEEEEAILDKLYKSDPLFGYCLELFYLYSYRLIKRIEEKKPIFAHELADIKAEYLDITYVLHKTKVKARPKIEDVMAIDRLIDKFMDTVWATEAIYNKYVIGKKKIRR